MDRPFSKLPKIDRPFVYLSTPTSKYSPVDSETARFCAAMAGHPQVVWAVTRGCSPSFSRNCSLEHQFRRDPNWTHVLFVDSDVVPPIDTLGKFLEIDADFVTGLYPLHLSEGAHWAVSTMTLSKKGYPSWIPMQEELPKEPFETLACGAGCMLVRKEVLVDIGYPWFEITFQKLYDNDGNGIKEGEDVFFARRARECGYKVIAHPGVVCGHFNKVDLLRFWEDAKRQLSVHS